jgi:hypothetical protein
LVPALITGGSVVEVVAEPVSPISESKAKFVVMSNILGGIRDYDCGGWLAPEAHEDVAMAVMRCGKKPDVLRPLNKDVRRLLRIA